MNPDNHSPFKGMARESSLGSGVIEKIVWVPSLEVLCRVWVCPLIGHEDSGFSETFQDLAFPVSILRHVVGPSSYFSLQRGMPFPNWGVDTEATGSLVSVSMLLSQASMSCIYPVSYCQIPVCPHDNSLPKYNYPTADFLLWGRGGEYRWCFYMGVLESQCRENVYDSSFTSDLAHFASYFFIIFLSYMFKS